MAVARDVGAGFEHLHVVAGMRELVRNDCSGKSSTDDRNILFHRLILIE
jgi:hypothetical protein